MLLKYLNVYKKKKICYKIKLKNKQKIKLLKVLLKKGLNEIQTNFNKSTQRPY